MMKKRILSLLLALLMVVTLMPTAAFAEKSDTDIAYAVTGGNIYFDESTGTITDCDDTVTAVEVPVAIGNALVHNIGDSAFKDCTELKSIALPYVMRIGDSAFEGCTSLTNVEEPINLTSIGYCAFWGCTNLENITIHYTVTSIRGGAFWDCTSLKRITIPFSVTSIGSTVFKNCTSLTSIDVVATNTAYSSVDGVLFNKDKTELIQYPAGKTDASYVVPNSVTSIGGWAFYNCTNLTNVTIPSGVSSIEIYAFEGCTGLTSVTIPNSVTSIHSSFFDCDSLTSINVADDNTTYCSIDGVLFNKDKTELIQYPAGKTDASYVVPNSVTSIQEPAFWNCTSLTSVTIPDSVTNIGGSLFHGCTSLTSVTIPDSVASIGSAVFYDCTSLMSVMLPNSLTSIGWYMFCGCESLTSVTIPDSVTSIGERAFFGCKSLSNVTIPGSVTSIGYEAFWCCESLTSITIPDSVTSIGEYAFKYCTGLTSVTIPNSVTSIEHGVFLGCESLTSITIPDSVTSIGYGAFWFCDSLTDVYYSGSEEQWKEISIDDSNEYYLSLATIHYNHKHSYENGVCTECGAKDSGYTPPHTHDYTAVVTAPTCTEKGYTTYTCACGDSYVGSYTNALGHSYVNGVCTRCSATDPDYHTHSYTAAVTAPTCTEKGYTTYTCACGDSYVGSYTNALGHNYVNGVCTRCSATDPDYHVHDYTGVVTAPTCTAKGYMTYTCACGDSYVDSYTNALGHNYKDGVCTRCSAAEPKSEDGSIIVSTAKARAGSNVTLDISLKDNPGVCGIALEIDYDTDKLELVSYEDGGLTGWLVAKKAVWFSSGADSSYNGVILRLIFKVKEDVEDGTIPVTVSYSSGGIANYDEKLLFPSVVAGGVTVFSVLPGDITGDGDVDVTDLIRLKKFIADDTTELSASADLNGDNKVDILDLIRLKKIIAGDTTLN